MNPMVLTSMAAVSTSVGGYCAVLLRRRVHLLMAFGAGMLIGAACLDLVPSALSAAQASHAARLVVFPIAAAGGLLIFVIGKANSHLSAHRGEGRAAGKVSAGFLILHSTLDGTAIFAASTISIQMGLIVGLGVVAHDISDGLNMILLATGGRSPDWGDYALLIVDAVAPVAGGLIAAHLMTVSGALVMVFLSLAAGSFLFNAMFSLLPDAWRRGPRPMLSWVAFAGFAIVFCLTRLFGSLG
jgi:zinc transporter ZupT